MEAFCIVTLKSVRPLPWSGSGNEPYDKVAIGTVKGSGYKGIDLDVDCDVFKYAEAVEKPSHKLDSNRVPNALEKTGAFFFPGIGKCAIRFPMFENTVRESGASYRVRAKDLPKALQPREKFDRLGAENLSETDLLALILRTGAAGLNVVGLAEELLLQYGSLSALTRTPVGELQKIRGIGREKAKILKAALEVGRRLVQESVGENPQVATPEEAAAVLRERARGLDCEVFWVLLLDIKTRLMIPPCEVSRGTLNSSLVHPREIFKPAVRHSAAKVILAHNHPSGDPSPSTQDIKITRKLAEVGCLMEIDVLDHVIIGRKRREGGDDFFSLRESGLVSFHKV